MRRAPSRAPRYDSGPNMTPLVDVVMVLLIFLMLAGRFASGEHYLESRRPDRLATASATAGPGPVAPDGVPPARLDVYVSAPAPGRFAARTRAFGAVADAQTLADRMSDERARYEADSLPADRVTVVLHAAPNTPWGTLAAAYDATVRAGFKKVAFAMSPK